MNKLLVKQISLFSGGGLVFLAGLFYVLMTDLKMNNSATWLFIGIILAFGGSILFLLCESTKEKPKLLYPLKGGSILLSIGYVVFLFLFKNTDVYKNITLEGAIPCRNQDERWNDESKKRYAKIKKECDFLTYISDEYTPTCMNDRNKYMVDHSAVVIAVWNGKPSGTGNTVRFAKDRGCKVKILNPNTYN